MYYLYISDKCDGCNICEEHLPGVRDYVKANTFLLVSHGNMFNHSLDIAKAIDCCTPEAISLRGYDEEETE